MLASSLGVINASVEAFGSRYATRGELTGWLPKPARRSVAEEIVLSIDGVDVSRTPQQFNLPRAHKPEGNRNAFSVTIPAEYYGRTVLLGLRTRAGAQVGDGEIQLDIDRDGNAFLASLSENLLRVLEKAPQFVREGKLKRAQSIYQRSCCGELYADFQTSLAAARCFAACMDRDSAQVVLTCALMPAIGDYRSLAQVGKLLLSLDRHDEALDLFDRAIAKDPQGFDARNGRIKAIIGQEDWHAALAEAHRLRHATPPEAPQLAELAGTIAWLYLNISEPERALSEATIALLNYPANLRLMQMRGDALVRLSRYKEAIEVYKAALAKDVKSPLLRKRMASALMLVGEFGASADQDVGRILTPTFAKLNNVPQEVPLWRGEPRLPGKLLVWSEVNFGVGQNLLHASLVPELVEIGLDVVLEVEPRLVPLMKAAMPELEVVEQVPPGSPRGAWMEDVVSQIPIGSLSRYLRREWEDFDASKAYLWHDRPRAVGIRSELLARTQHARFLIGISWTSNNPYVGDDKSVALADLLASLDLPGAAVVNLQYGDHQDDIAEAVAKTGVPVLQYPQIDNTNDLAGLCDLMGALDLVVCIGHTTAHLAGGLGIPNMVMVPSSPFSHWLGAGERCIWYPTSVVLRQSSERRRDWAAVLAEVQQRVAQKLLRLPDPSNQPSASIPDSVANFCRNALQLAMSGYQYDVVETLLSFIEQRYPLNAMLMENVGDCQFRVGEFSRAIRSYNIALVAGGDKAQLTRKKALVLLENYDLESADELLEALFHDHPELQLSHPELVVMHAQVVANQRRFSRVTTILSDLLARDPGNVETALTSAHALSQTGEHDRARMVLRNALEIAASPEIERTLGVEIGHAGMPELAVRALDRTLSNEREAVGVFWRGQFAAPHSKPGPFRLSALDGSLPAHASAGITVYVCMDTSYCMKYLRAIAGSIVENAPSTKLHVHIVNPHEAALNLADIAGKIMGPDRFSCSFERTKLASFNAEARKTYYASIRFVRLAEIMRACPGTYYVMDADNIVRGELRSCIALTHGADVLIRNRFTLRPHLAVAACGIVLSDTEAARDFLDRTARYILTAFRTGDVAWFLDQIALTIAMNESPSERGLELSVKQLPAALLDWDFLDESLVWTGKGKRRSRNERYLLEYQHYFETFGQPVSEVA